MCLDPKANGNDGTYTNAIKYLFDTNTLLMKLDFEDTCTLCVDIYYLINEVLHKPETFG